ncbi:MAG: hypothetical protein HGGPFJEG_00633 [Ignavibacteria bacterium]|nr:hypothetical protein [Ignavibacteria bacterium]
MIWFWLAIFSALLSAAAAILQKRSLKDMSALNFSVAVSILIALLSTPLLFFTGFEKLTSESLFYLFLKSLVNAGAFLCIMTALKNLELSRTLPVLAASPLFIALLAYFFLGEDLNKFEVAGMLLIVAGTYILEIKKNENALYPLTVFRRSVHHRIIVLALILITISSVMDKFILVKFKLPPVLFVVIQNYFFLVVFSIIYLLSGKKKELIAFSKQNKYLIFILIVISITTITYRLLQIEAVKLAPVSLVISLKRLSVFFAVLIGAKIFREESYVKKIIATALIVGGAMMIYRE